MPTNYFIFSTGGDWDSTTLYNNGDEYLADQLYLELQSGRDDYGNLSKGGLTRGGQMTAFVSPQGSNGSQVGIFPGKIEMQFPVHKVTIENETPTFLIEFTKVLLDDEDVTAQVTDLLVNIDAVNNDVQAYVMMYKPHFLSSDEVATINLI